VQVTVHIALIEVFDVTSNSLSLSLFKATAKRGEFLEARFSQSFWATGRCPSAAPPKDIYGTRCGKSLAVFVAFSRVSIGANVAQQDEDGGELAVVEIVGFSSSMATLIRNTHTGNTSVIQTMIPTLSKSTAPKA
jgi:hypothetical protein